MQNNLEIHPHQEFHFAPDTNSSGCCCFWKSKSSKNTEYIVDDRNRLKPAHNVNAHKRIEANQRLASILEEKFDNDPIENNRAFEMLKNRINESFDQNSPITDERLEKIIAEMYKLKEEINKRRSNE